MNLQSRLIWLRKDGAPIALIANSSPIRESSGEVVGTAVVARRFIGGERADATLRSLLEAAPDAMVCVNGGGVIALVNAHAEQLFGYASNELTGTPVVKLLPDWGVTPSTPDPDQPQIRGPQPMGPGQELVARRKDGSNFPAEISVSSLDTREGVLVAATIRDGTERRLAAIVASSADAIVGVTWTGPSPVGTQRPSDSTATRRPKRLATTCSVCSRRANGPLSSIITISNGCTEANWASITRPGGFAVTARSSRSQPDNSSSLIAVKDPNGRYVFMNRALAKIFGVDREAAIGQATGGMAPAGAARLAESNDLEVLRRVRHCSTSSSPPGLLGSGPTWSTSFPSSTALLRYTEWPPSPRISPR